MAGSRKYPFVSSTIGCASAPAPRVRACGPRSCAPAPQRWRPREGGGEIDHGTVEKVSAQVVAQAEHCRATCPQTRCQRPVRLKAPAEVVCILFGLDSRCPACPTTLAVRGRVSVVRSRDITRLLGPTKWTYFYLYVVLDIFSRYAVGWMVADRENSALADRLIEETCHKQGVRPQVLTLHSDRGAPMTSKCTAQLLADLGVTRSLSRPHVSDDNPFSEAQFKTLKYHPGFPGRFHNISAAIAFCRTFFPWYNTEHRHGGIAMLTRNMSITIEPRACCTSADGPFKSPGPVIPSASFGASQSQTPYPERSGLIHP